MCASPAASMVIDSFPASSFFWFSNHSSNLITNIFASGDDLSIIRDFWTAAKRAVGELQVIKLSVN